MRLEEIQKQATDRISELETQLMQATKETELLKVSAACCTSFKRMQDKVKMQELMTLNNNNEKSVHLIFK